MTRSLRRPSPFSVLANSSSRAETASDTLVSGNDDDEDDDSAAPPEDAPNNQDALIEAREKLLELTAIHKKLMTALNKGKTLDDKKPETARRNQRIHRRLLLPAKNHPT